MLAAFMGDWMGRRVAYFVLCVASLASAWSCFGHKRLRYGLFALVVHCRRVHGIVLRLAAAFICPSCFTPRAGHWASAPATTCAASLAAIGVLQVGNLLKVFDHDVTLAGFHNSARTPACLLGDLPGLPGRHGAESGSAGDPRPAAARLSWLRRYEGLRPILVIFPIDDERLDC